jgi:ATP-dependent DNA helicase HFM1/MER3
VHLLKDKRGATLEAVVTRMKRRTNLRVVAVSATIPNIADVGMWIAQPWSSGGTCWGMSNAYFAVSARTLAFGEEYRPVRLDRCCYGYPQLEGESDFQFDAKLNKQ